MTLFVFVGPLAALLLIAGVGAAPQGPPGVPGSFPGFNCTSGGAPCDFPPFNGSFPFAEGFPPCDGTDCPQFPGNGSFPEGNFKGFTPPNSSTFPFWPGGNFTAPANFPALPNGTFPDGNFAGFPLPNSPQSNPSFPFWPRGNFPALPNGSFPSFPGGFPAFNGANSIVPPSGNARFPFVAAGPSSPSKRSFPPWGPFALFRPNGPGSRF